MRIVSQNGKIDVPYEMTALRATDNHIRMCMVGDTGKGSLLAEYSSPEKVQKAMEMLRMGYVGLMPSLIISDRGFSQTDLEDLKQSMVGGQIIRAGTDSVEYHMLPRIFRFPADDEIEVEEC
ncbi:MAG TPA: hypothetical protein DC053_11480 [Lachnoclostridium sp.]|nr:hypothetical protein [Lachnoclostridium sp.]